MTNFRTELHIEPSANPIGLSHPICTAGSCFADAIGNRLQENKFNTLINPMGITYNPHSIHTQLLYALHNQPIPEHTFIENNGIHVNYNFHSEFSALSKPDLIRKLSENIGHVHYFVRDTRWLIITYGTAWVYSRKDTGEIVANCHKMPQALFEKELYTQKKMLDSFEELHKELKAFNPSINILLTVSPVRHIKDSISLNSVSKAVLRLGCHTLSEQYPDVHYFPAYELVMDDLRDYRFYKGDLIHPSQEAENYIWEKFTDSHLDKEAKSFVENWRDILSALRHKPFHPSSPSHQSFLKDLLSKLERLKGRINVEKELANVNAQLNT
ncbi:MAG: GSCFA domain-containing protein [Cyclobacteriaceae bacterium]|nr:GSCFA domain-containing protein [Cyclobacteriaceae bacterium]